MKRMVGWRRHWAVLAVAAVSMSTALTVGSVAQGHPPKPAQRDGLAAASTGVQRGPAWTQAMQTTNFTVVGHSDLGGGGLNADVWVHRGFAYVGVWSGTCPASGVKVADARRANAPRVVARLSNPRGTSAEDVVVRTVRTKAFTGDLAVVGIQTCEDPKKSPAFRGLQFWDVTTPARPRPLSQWRSSFRGCHEVDMVVRDSRLLAACAEPFAEPETGADEVDVVDVTNPARPRKVSGFALKRDAGIDSTTTPQNVGCGKASFAHSVRFTGHGRTLYVSYWDVGTLRFDVRSSGKRLRLVNRADIAPPDEDGDNHSMTLAKGGAVMVVNPEDFSPEDPNCAANGGWGEVHLLTNTRRTPRHLATFSTPDSRSTRKDGFFSVHNTEVVKGTQAFSSWYTDGIVWWTLTDPRHPVMRGQFVPPPTEDPQKVFPPVPIVWGVFPDRRSNLIFASDINSGLWILRPTGLGSF
jgi:hypothetical protein